jgi:hypothetical protein
VILINLTPIFSDRHLAPITTATRTPEARTGTLILFSKRSLAEMVWSSWKKPQRVSNSGKETSLKVPKKKWWDVTKFHWCSGCTCGVSQKTDCERGEEHAPEILTNGLRLRLLPANRAANDRGQLWQQRIVIGRQFAIRLLTVKKFLTVYSH